MMMIATCVRFNFMKNKPQKAVLLVENDTAALPALQAEIRKQVRGLVDKLNGKNWRDTKREVLVMLNA